MENTAEEIRSIRQKTGLSQAAFSATYGIPLRTLEDWEAGRRSPPGYVVSMLRTISESRK